jgi:uncharacterized protein
VEDILQALARPGRDPREDLPPPIFKKGILRLEDLHSGMELKGTVLNVVDFGAFVDIGLKDSGLVHISQMANRYIKSPYDVVGVSDIVKVWVLTVDKERHRVSLTMIQPGTERKPTEGGQSRPSRESRPPRGRRLDGSLAPEEGQRHGAGQGPAGHGAPGHGVASQGTGRPPRRRGPGRRGPGGPPPGTSAHAGGSTPPSSAGPQALAGPTETMETGPAQNEPARSAPPGPPPRPAPPPRKPRREPPKPKLSQAALDGKVPLRTFGELSALFAAKKEPEKTSPPAEPAASAEVTDPAPLAPTPVDPAPTSETAPQPQLPKAGAEGRAE